MHRKKRSRSKKKASRKKTSRKGLTQKVEAQTFEELETMVRKHNYSAKYLKLPTSVKITGKISKVCKPRTKLLKSGIAGEVFELSKTRVVKDIIHETPKDAAMTFVEGLISSFASKHGFGPKVYNFAYYKTGKNNKTSIEMQRAAQTVEEYLKHNTICNVLRKVAKVIRKAHDHGIVHMDCHIGNVMLLPNQKATLIDFGGSFAFDLNDAKQRTIFEQVKYIDLFVFFDGLYAREKNGKTFADFLKLYDKRNSRVEELYRQYSEHDNCATLAKTFAQWKVLNKHPLVHLYGKKYLRNRLQKLARCCKCIKYF